MLRLPFHSTSTLIRQLGLKHHQPKVCPFLYSAVLCTGDERRAAHFGLSNQLKGRLLQSQPNLLPNHGLSSLHTSSTRPKPSTPSPKEIISNFQKEAYSVLKKVNIKEIKNAPNPIKTLGFSGLIPFVLPPLTVLLNGAFLPNLALAQLAYGCTILAFLGGVKWGFTLPADSCDKPTYNNLGISVTWPLIAWVALLMPPALGTITLMGGIGAAAYLDLVNSSYPQWFKALRLCLSAVAAGSLFLMLLLRLIL